MATRGKQAEVTDLCYLAGVIDSDGCISISKMKAGAQRTKTPRYVLTVNVVNTSEDLMRWLVKKFGGRYKCRRKMSQNHKATYDWWFNNGKAVELLRLVRPYLLVKRDRADLGIAFIEGWVQLRNGPGTRTPPEEVARRECFYQEMKAFNQFGPAAATTKSPSPCHGTAG